MTNSETSALLWVMARVDGRLVLNIEETADALGMGVKTIYNAICNGSFPVPMRKNGNRWFSDARDIADYIDKLRAEARGGPKAASLKTDWRSDNLMPELQGMTERSFVSLALAVYSMLIDDERQTLLERINEAVKTSALDADRRLTR